MELGDKYSEEIEKIYDLHEPGPRIKATLVTVIYEPEKDDLRELLNSLDDQTVKRFETIIIDNGTDWPVKEMLQRHKSVTRYVVMKKNYGLTIGRNIGANMAQGDILIFLDDDGIPRKDFVEENLKAHRKYDIVALRGKIIPKGDDIFSRLAPHYDLGDEPHPYLIDTEGNSSFKKEYLLDIGGFNEELAGSGGHEGTEVTYRLVKNGVEKDRIIYYPKVIIYHDYISGFREYLTRKTLRQSEQKDLLIEQYPQLYEFAEDYEPPNIRSQTEPSERVKVLLIKLISHLILFLWSNLRKGKEEK
ncbi:MAG: glycosyltransferase family 2 protein [Candidatus Thermoplasmatota archaeon]|nr:glycosyltransferase family 2 protein [Candidatus Thermoplasmatota archaeon]